MIATTDLTNAPKELPLYVCHKQVRAALITSIEAGAGNEVVLHLDIDGTPLAVTKDQAWYAKHDPAPGGYFVQYTDGYTSYSPAKAFEEGYSRLNMAPVRIDTSNVPQIDPSIASLPLETGEPQ